MTSFTFYLGDTPWYVEAEIEPGYAGQLNGSMDFAEESFDDAVEELTITDAAGNDVCLDGYPDLLNAICKQAISYWKQHGDDDDEADFDYGDAA